MSDERPAAVLKVLEADLPPSTVDIDRAGVGRDLVHEPPERFVSTTISQSDLDCRTATSPRISTICFWNT